MKTIFSLDCRGEPHRREWERGESQGGVEIADVRKMKVHRPGHVIDL